MKQSRCNPATRWALSAGTLSALCCALLAQPAQAQAQTQAAQSQAAQSQAAQSRAGQSQAGQSQAGQAAAREQGAATRQQTRKTEQANRAAAVEDETSSTAQAARTAQSEAAQFEATQRRNAGAAAPSYGPVLTPRGQPPADAARKDPAEVHDETDSQTRQAAPAQPAPSSRSVREPQASRQVTQPAAPRRPAWQPAAEPLAPRPLRPAESTASIPVPVPAPVTPPPPVVPTSRVIGSCAGNVCRDTNGNTYNGIGTGTAGVNSNGRLCTRTGTTVQCF